MDPLDGKSWKIFPTYKAAQEVIEKVVPLAETYGNIWDNCYHSSLTSGSWDYFSCFDFGAKLSKKYRERYEVVNHVLPWSCKDPKRKKPQWTYCMRFNRRNGTTIVTKHDIGNCHCCVYKDEPSWFKRRW